MEIWKKIRGWPYEVSDRGKIRRSEKSRSSPKGKIMKAHRNRGYLKVMLSRKGQTKTFIIHRLVCCAFYGPPPSSKHHAAHHNGVKDDNRAINLSWKTPKENEADKVKHGTTTRGSHHKLAKLNEQKVKKIKRILAVGTITQKKIAEMFGVNKSKISHISTGISWKHVS